jgi:NAD(P)-dependent dehydrogenase (short-subunit alcohol dehydrogenase family)
MSDWTARDIPDQSGRTAIITGANTGLGYQTALALAGAGAKVVLTARNADKGSEAVRRIITLQPSARITFSLLDLASLKSVAAFSHRMADQTDRIDLLINNAGVAAPKHRLTTSDGFELQFGTNFPGHFTLTSQLRPLLARAGSARRGVGTCSPYLSTVNPSGHGALDARDAVRLQAVTKSVDRETASQVVISARIASSFCSTRPSAS